MNPILLYRAGTDDVATFTTVWNTETTGGTGSVSKRIVLPTIAQGTYSCKIDWGDGTAITILNNSNWNTANIHNYAVGGTYTIKITGIFVGFRFNFGGDKLKITSVLEWGCLRLAASLSTHTFYGCTNLSLSNVKDTLQLLGVTNLTAFAQAAIGLLDFKKLSKWTFQPNTNLTQFFLGCVNVNIPDLGQLNTINVINMSNLFRSAAKFNADISTWNTQNVTAMDYILSGCELFNFPIGIWDVSKVTNFTYMMNSCTAFNQPVLGWNTVSATTMAGMFIACTNFNKSVSHFVFDNATSLADMFNSCSNFNNGHPSGEAHVFHWDLKNVTDVSSLFINCIRFNQNIDSWNVSMVRDFSGMLNNCDLFNQPVNSWNTSSALNMTGIFGGTAIFNQPLNTYSDGGGIHWDMSNVTTMTNMFQNALKFNQNLNAWSVSKVTNMQGMFQNADAFNQDLDTWNTAALITMTNLFSGAIAFNGNMSNWITSKVTAMNGCFNGAVAFNRNIGFWDVSKVTNFTSMFSGASIFNNNGSNIINYWIINTAANVTMNSMFANAWAFNQPLATYTDGNGTHWDVSRVTTMASMFLNANVFNQSINTWNTVALTTADSMFYGADNFNNGLASGVSGVLNIPTPVLNDIGNMFREAVAFNCSVSDFDTSRCTGFPDVFNGAINYNQPMNTVGVKWDVSKGTSFSSMFLNAAKFNNGLASGVSSVLNWDVSKGTNFSNMFQNAISFNGNISGWNTSSATNMTLMFSNTPAFNQNIGSWDVSKVTLFTNFMAGATPSTFSAANLDAIYNGWITRELLTAKSISFGTAKYTAAGINGRLLLSKTNTALSITAATNVGGLIRLTTAAHGLTTGNKVYVKGMASMPNATGLWTVTVISTTVVELQGSVFAGSFSAGGTMRTGYGWTIVDGGV